MAAGDLRSAYDQVVPREGRRKYSCYTCICDDLLIMGSTNELIKEAKKTLHKQFKVIDFELKS